MQPPKKPPSADEPFANVIRDYLVSPKFLSLASGTQGNYARLLRFAQRPDTLGAVPVSVLRPALVQAFLDGLTSDQIGARVAIKAVEKWAIKRDRLQHTITLGTEVETKGDGHKPWTQEQIDCAIQHAKPELARVIMVAAATGQRGSDLIKMRWSELEEVDGRLGINVTQRKTGVQLWIPFTATLAAAIKTWKMTMFPILLRDDGGAWTTRAALSKAWERERDSNPDLVPCRGAVLHGLRASACVRLRRLGSSEAGISAMVGLSIPMVSRYCRLSDQKKNAMAEVLRLDGTPYEQTGRKKRMVTD